MIAIELAEGLEACPNPDCDEGEVPVRACDHTGNCPCGPSYERCPTCRGRMVIRSGEGAGKAAASSHHPPGLAKAG